MPHQSKKRKINFNLDDFEETETEKRREILELLKAVEDCSIDESLDYLDIEIIIRIAVIKFRLNFIELY